MMVLARHVPIFRLQLYPLLAVSPRKAGGLEGSGGCQKSGTPLKDPTIQ